MDVSTHERIAVIGAGAWGTTLANMLGARGFATSLVTHTIGQADAMRASRVNARYLPGVAIPASVSITADLTAAASDATLVLAVLPSQRLHDGLRPLRDHLAADAVIVSCAKGFETGTLARMTEVVVAATGIAADRVCALSGPNLAAEIAAGLPASTVVASTGPAAAERVQRALSSSRLRVYTSDDVVGVEYGGALKNVVAIGAGAADGLELGQNAKAAFITRGLAEIIRLGVAAGANPLTFGGLSGLGDLIATCESPLSRNRTFGERIGRGQPPEAASAASPHVIEGLTTARVAVELGGRYGVATPIASTVVSVLDGQLEVRAAIELLMRREARPERDDSRGR
jgi:glycerol-3-phosphate dehydrogenase (NAD(P)+)